MQLYNLIIMWYTKNLIKTAQLAIIPVPADDAKNGKKIERYNYYVNAINKNIENKQYLHDLYNNLNLEPNDRFDQTNGKAKLQDTFWNLLNETAAGTGATNAAGTTGAQGTTNTPGALNVENIKTTISNFLIPKNIQSHDPDVTFSEGNYFVNLKLQTNQPGAPILPYGFNFKTQEELTARLNSVAEYLNRPITQQNGQSNQSLSSPEQQQSSQQNSQTNNVEESTSNKDTLSGKKININPLLVSPYGNQKMPGYAQIGTEKATEKTKVEKEPVDEMTKNTISDTAKEKLNDSNFQYQIPGTGIYLGYTFEPFDKWVKSTGLTELSATLIDPMRKIPNYSLDNNIKLTVLSPEVTYPKNNISEPILKNAIDNEIKQFYDKLFNLLDKFDPKISDYEWSSQIKLVDARLTTLEIQDFITPKYKRTAIPIQVESARTTYNDRVPIDIYLDGKLLKKGYPNNTYLTLDPNINLLSKGSHKLLAVDSRPNMPQNIVQSKTQEIEFRAEPNEEIIIFNITPNRVIR